MTKPMLHVYPAKYWQDTVLIVGTKAGLEDLKTCIEKCLQNPQLGFHTDLPKSDHTPYQVGVTCIPEDVFVAATEDLPPPYEDDEEVNESEMRDMLTFISQYAD